MGSRSTQVTAEAMNGGCPPSGCNPGVAAAAYHRHPGRVPLESHLSHLIPPDPGESRQETNFGIPRDARGSRRDQSTSSSPLATVQPMVASAPSARSG